MSAVDERREVVYGLSVDEARECLVQIGEQRVQHEAMHGLPNPTVRQALNEIVRKLYSKEEAREYLARAQDDVVDRLREDVRRLAYRYPDEKVHGQLLMDLNELEEHWRANHPDEPKPGVEYLRRVVTKVRQHPR
jgi:hypothetical protein